MLVCKSDSYGPDMGMITALDLCEIGSVLAIVCDLGLHPTLL